MITSKSILFFSADDGRLTGQIDGLQEPRLLLKK